MTEPQQPQQAFSPPTKFASARFTFRQVGWYGPYGIVPGEMDNDAADHWRPVYIETSAPLYRPPADAELEIDGDDFKRRWFVNVESPFRRERNDRNYGPFTEAEARVFAEKLPGNWRAQVCPLLPPDQVRSP